MSSIIQKENFQYEKQQFTILGNVPALPYICNVCEMAFAKKYFIRSHLMTVHEVSLINFLVLILLSFSNNCGNGVDGHAIFWEPPSRASLGKHNMNFCKVPVNNNHMSLWCGGIKVRNVLNLHDII